jgi:hypothetical protein
MSSDSLAEEREVEDLRDAHRLEEPGEDLVEDAEVGMTADMLAACRLGRLRVDRSCD